MATDFVLDDAALAAAARAGEPSMAEHPSRAVIDVAQAIGVLIATGADVTPAEDVGASHPATILIALSAVGIGVVGNGFRRMRRGLPFSAPNAGSGTSHQDTWHSHGGGGTHGGSGSS